MPDQLHAIAGALDRIERRVASNGRKLDNMLEWLRYLLQEGEIMSAELDALTAQVKANTDVEESAIVLIKGIADQLATCKNEPAKIQALSDTLSASAAKLGAAIVANTPPAVPGGTPPSP